MGGKWEGNADRDTCTSEWCMQMREFDCVPPTLFTLRCGVFGRFGALGHMYSLQDGARKYEFAGCTGPRRALEVQHCLASHGWSHPSTTSAAAVVLPSLDHEGYYPRSRAAVDTGRLILRRRLVQDITRVDAR